MNFIGTLLQTMERGSAGSEETAETVLSLCGKISAERALFVGDDVFTPLDLTRKTGCRVTAAFTDGERARRAAEAGLDAVTVQLFELPEAKSGYGLIWYNGVAEFDGVSARLEQLKGSLDKGGVLIYRTLSWLIDPSPDTEDYCRRRFGVIEPLDRILSMAREAGFTIWDFYIAPKTDWTKGYYEPLSAAAAAHGGACEDGEASGVSEFRKEKAMFELHCEEYSYVYYIMKG